MASQNYLLIGILGIVAFSALTVGLNQSSTNDSSITKIMVSLDNKESSTVFIAYKPTPEVFTPSGMTINFSENKVGPSNMNCKLTCQPMEGDAK